MSQPVSHRVVFTPSGLSGTVADATTVLDAARGLGVDLDTVCGGRGICGRCQVVPSLGSFAKWGLTVDSGALSDPASIEVDYRGHRPLVAGQRLGCSARIQGDIVIDVPQASQVHRQVVRKDLDLPPMVVDPSFSLFYVEIPRAVLGDEASVSTVVRRAVAEQHGRGEPTVSSALPLLSSLQRSLDRGGGAVTVAIEHSDLDTLGNPDGQPTGDRIVAIWPGFVDGAYGVAVDIGSTTIAGHLCDLTTGAVVASAGRMNPQIRFGEDLMSRVSYVMMNPGGDAELTNAVRTSLDDLIGDLVDQIGTSREYVLDVVLVGNPIMHHLLLGIDPTPLGQAPFTLATDEPVRGYASQLDLALPNARFYVGPCIAGHVGADTTAAILAEGPHRSDAMQLLVDVGTNAEIVLGNRERQFAASSPTGPAFEGAQISSGQRASTGAIEGVRIDAVTLEPRIKVIGCDVWSDHPDFDDAVATTGISGICGSGIIDVIAEMYLAGIVDPDGTIRGELTAVSPRIVSDGRTFSYVLRSSPDEATSRSVTDRIAITQNDVRAVQLAKAALRAGIDLLIEHAGSPDVTDIRLAGAFGAHIDPLHAMVLGLVPDCPIDGVRAVGNAAGTGAVQALLSRSLRREMEHAARNVVKIETAIEPRFQELFINAMAMPHATASTPNLNQLVDLPVSHPKAEGAAKGRRRRTHQRSNQPGPTQAAGSTSPGTGVDA